eukprot:gene33783-40878_t
MGPYYFHAVVVLLALCFHYSNGLSLSTSGVAPGELVHSIRSGLEQIGQAPSESEASSQDVRIETARFVIDIYQANVFKLLRRHCGVSEALYRDNLDMAKLHSLLADSKSGQLFLRSADDMIIIKTIKQYECATLVELLPSFAEHVITGPSLLGNLLGVYKVRTKAGDKYVMVSKNIYHNPDSSAASCSLYDLKGSTVGRRKSAASFVFKDLDLLDRIQQQSTGISIGPENKRTLLDVLKRDVEYLSKHNLMDYSLLVRVDESSAPHTSFSYSSPSFSRGKMVFSGPSGSTVHCGLIDFLQRYSLRKRLETLVKGWYQDAAGISCVSPVAYAQRLLRFIDLVTH